jgi:glycerophosphoryl diester phosphodiesterase
MPKFNVPDKNDPQFREKIISLLEEIFTRLETNITNFPPIDAPQDALQAGDLWFDKATGKLYIRKPDETNGILKYE